jgi:hypothetical protein
VPEGEEMSLAALLALFEPEEPTTAARPQRRLVAWRSATQNWVQRAAEWGSGPGGAWRAW